MSAREGVLARRTAMAEQGMPWIQTADGTDKAKPGRKTNAERQTRGMLEVVSTSVGDGDE